MRTELAQTELAQTELAQTELAQTELAQTELARTELVRTELVRTELVRTELIAELEARAEMRQLEELKVFNSLKLSIVLLMAVYYWNSLES